MKNKTAFVASTLPARFLMDNLEQLGVDRVVCASNALKLSYSFLCEKFSCVEVISVPSKKSHRAFLESEILLSASCGIVIFHECCWLELDVVILGTQPTVFHYPCVTLDSFRKLSTEELSISYLLRRVICERSKVALRLLWYSVNFKKKFDFYELTEDNEKSEKSYVASLKKEVVKKLIFSNEALRSRNLKIPSRLEQNSKNIIFIVATDVVSNARQEVIFQLVAELCKKYGFNILIKDHPNPAARLNLKNLGRNLSPYVPFEVLDEPHFIKIGLFSTTLVYEAEKSISVAELFLPKPDDFRARMAHLSAIPGGDLIKFIPSLDELEQILISNLP